MTEPLNLREAVDGWKRWLWAVGCRVAPESWAESCLDSGQASGSNPFTISTGTAMEWLVPAQSGPPRIERFAAEYTAMVLEAGLVDSSDAQLVRYFRVGGCRHCSVQCALCIQALPSSAF
jgi:hypothetical protein